MSYLYRHALTITRKRPYLDWANGLDDNGPVLAEDVSRDQRTIFLVPEAEDGRPDLNGLLDEFWDDIFKSELSAWIIADERWPASRTREMFDRWFDVEMTDAVYDLTPEEPLTQADMDAADLDEMMSRCASCGLEIGEDDGRFAGFKLADRARYELFEGRVLPLPVDAEEVVLGIVTRRDSEAAREGNDFVVRVCSNRCERTARSVVPKALRKASRRPNRADGEP